MSLSLSQIFLFIYTVEMLVKMVALGPCNYFKVRAISHQVSTVQMTHLFPC